MKRFSAIFFSFAAALLLCLSAVSCHVENQEPNIERGYSEQAFNDLLGKLVDADKSSKADVDAFVGMLRAGTYIGSKLPAFTEKHIPALLSYTDNTELFSPVLCNPSSSYWMESCTIGFYALWTIESIRISAAMPSDYVLYQSFPSQIPAIVDAQITTEAKLYINDPKVQQDVTAFYKLWWNYYGMTLPFVRAAEVNPLYGSPYRWR